MDAHELLGISKNATEREIRTAHRALARRWHPDRFQQGPERLWAESKMIEINIAYETALESCTQMEQVDEITPETLQFEDVRSLMKKGQLPAARRALMRIAVRSAEWNYLFGAVLLRLGEVEKALLYFSIATKQRPDNPQYRTALQSAQFISEQKPRTTIIDRIFQKRG